MGTRDRLLELISQLYDAPGRQDHWARFLDQLCDAVAGSCAQFISVDPRGRSDLAFNVRADPAAKAAYEQHWGAHDPWGHSLRLRRATSGKVVLGDELVPHGDFLRTAYYSDFGRPFDLVRCIVGVIEAAPSAVSVITIARPQAHGPFGAEETALLGVVMPHLQRALQLHRRLAAAEAAADDFASLLQATARAVFLVNGTGAVTWMNRAAEAIVAARDGLTIDDGELRAVRSADTTRLRALLADAGKTSIGAATGAGGALSLGRATGRLPLTALVAPLRQRPDLFSRVGRAVAMVIVTDPERATIPDDDTLRTLFGLTPGEIALTRILVQGVTVAEAAARLGLRVESVRTRLKAIFEKTGTHRQAELVRLVLLGATRL